MKKTIFVIAGFRHSAKEPQYQWMRKFFSNLGYNVKVPDITWNKTVFSDNVQQFISYYNKHKTEENIVLGFSFGAMIALATAKKLNTDYLYLCSLSPYFSEDLHNLKPIWQKYIGHRRYKDFKSYNAKELANQVTIPTVIIYGSAEAKKYPYLKKRCEETAKIIEKAKLVVANNAPHKIDYPTYMAAIKSEFTLKQ